MAKSFQREDLAPDRRKLTKTQATRLGALAGIEPKELAGLTVADLTDRFKWKINPELLLFRKICGKVVKKDANGVEYPVPFATVHVQDTDCTLLWYSPKPWPWGWFFPLNCRREELATVKTDSCGNFCVWVPRFDIDWILRWRKQRVCFNDIFVRPSIDDLVRIPRPIPDPDPGPLRRLPVSTVEALSGSAGRRLAQRELDIQSTRSFGAPAGADDSTIDRAFDAEMPPPLPEEFRRMMSGQIDIQTRKADPREAIRATIAQRAGIDLKKIEALDLGRFIGPFKRCIDVLLPEWQLIIDIPDITFKVTQDTNGDGTEEIIYSEGYFDVRWDAGTIPNVTLVASAIAKESHVCDTPDIACGNVPALLFAGLMPLTDANYFDSAVGYAKRPNRPIPPIGPRPDAETPFLGVLQLYGCVNVSNAQFYRVLLSTDNGVNFSAITGLQWNLYPVPSGSPVTVVADANGWYPVLPNPTDFHPARMVIEWPTPTLGKHVLKIELGNAAKNPIGTSANVAIQTDNTAPTITFNTLKWKFSSEGDAAFNLPGRDLLVTCPTIRRGAAPQSIDVQFDATVTAHHLRDGGIYVITCEGAAIPPLAIPAPHASHWHDAVTDNAEFLTGRYQISAAHLEGAYTF
ncbi:MAG TPA: hypothetical protein VF491_03755, partial [Vicinamibacterales bacterium]